MQWCQAVLIDNLKLRTKSQDVREGKFSFRVTRPVQRSASTIVLIVNIHVFKGYEVVKRTRLVTLSCHMEHISAIDILDCEVCTHLFDHESDELDIAVIGGEVKRCESFVCR